MKRILSLLLCFLFVLSSCSVADEPTAPSSNESEPAPVQLSVTTSRALEPYMTLQQDDLVYKGLGNVDGFGNYYVLIKSYEKLASVFENGEFVDPDIFESYYVLGVRRIEMTEPSCHYGYEDFRVEDGVAKVSVFAITERHSNTSDGYYDKTDFLLVPNTIECDEVDTFTDIRLIGITPSKSLKFYKQSVFGLDLSLDGSALLSAQELSALNSEHSLNYSIPENDTSYYVLFPSSLPEGSLRHEINDLGELSIRVEITDLGTHDYLCVLRLDDIEAGLSTKISAVRLNLIFHAQGEPYKKSDLQDIPAIKFPDPKPIGPVKPSLPSLSGDLIVSTSVDVAVSVYPVLGIDLLYRSDASLINTSPEYGDSYMIIKTYERFEAIYQNANWVDRKLFDDYDLLVVSRHYGGHYMTDFGFGNLRIENGRVTLDYFGYTGSWPYNDAEFGDTTYCLIPKTSHFEESKGFAPLVMKWNTVLINDENARSCSAGTLKEEISKPTVLNAEHFAEFVSKNELKYTIPENDSSYYLLLPSGIRGSYSLFDARASTSEGTMTIDIRQGNDDETNHICIIRLDSLAKVDNLTNVEINIHEYLNEVIEVAPTEQDLRDAINATLNAKNYSKSIFPSYYSSKGGIYLTTARSKAYFTSTMYLATTTLWYGTTSNSYYTSHSHAYFANYSNGTSCVAEQDNRWGAPTELVPHLCELEPSYSLEEIYALERELLTLLLDEFDNMVFDRCDTLRTSQIGDFYSISVSISNGKISRIFFRMDYNESANKYGKSFSISNYDFDTTVITPPVEGEKYE